MEPLTDAEAEYYLLKRKRRKLNDQLTDAETAFKEFEYTKQSVHTEYHRVVAKKRK